MLHLLLNSWQYARSFKKCLQDDGLLATIVVSLKEYFSEIDVCNMKKVCGML